VTAATRLDAWRVHDTGLVAVPTRFRRLGGLVRHLQGQGAPWPDRVLLELVGDDLRVTGADGPVGSWPRDVVSVTRHSSGPPVHFALELPDGSQLLAAPAGEATDAFLASLG
jgi:hypothetical protein